MSNKSEKTPDKSEKTPLQKFTFEFQTTEYGGQNMSHISLKLYGGDPNLMQEAKFRLIDILRELQEKHGELQEKNGS